MISTCFWISTYLFGQDFQLCSIFQELLQTAVTKSCQSLLKSLLIFKSDLQQNKNSRKKPHLPGNNQTEYYFTINVFLASKEKA